MQKPTSKTKQSIWIVEIRDPNFIESKIQNPGPKIGWNRDPLQLQDPKIC